MVLTEDEGRRLVKKYACVQEIIAGIPTEVLTKLDLEQDSSSLLAIVGAYFDAGSIDGLEEGFDQPLKDIISVIRPFLKIPEE